jgi:hypothetical protein
MSIYIESYPHLDATQTQESSFVWFISAADSQLLQAHFGMSHPPALARVLLDNGIVLSQALGWEGRIGDDLRRTGDL